MAEKTIARDSISASAAEINGKAQLTDIFGANAWAAGIRHNVNAYDSGRERKYAEGSPTIILIHGARGTLKMWGPFTKTIAKDYRTVAYEFNGHGSTDNAPFRDMGDYVSELGALMEKLKIDPSNSVLVGYSWGGDIAHAFAKQNKVLGTVLLGVNPGTTAWGAVKSNARFIKNEMFSKKAATIVSYDKNRLGGMAGISHAYPTKSFGEQKGKSPCLLINGEKDQMTTVAEARDVAARIPNSRLVVFENSWHQVVYSPRFEQELRSFVMQESAKTAIPRKK